MAQQLPPGGVSADEYRKQLHALAQAQGRQFSRDLMGASTGTVENIAWIPPEREALAVLEHHQNKLLRERNANLQQGIRLEMEIKDTRERLTDIEKRIAHMGLAIEALRGRKP